MTLDGPLRQVDVARAELSKAARRADGWSDKQRHAFDQSRMEPLDQAGERLLQALGKAQEQCVRAQRMLGD